jgi:dihydroflavonol-4-reductase
VASLKRAAGGGALLVTGAGGFLGQHLLAALRSRSPEQRVVALVRDPARWRAEHPCEDPALALLQGDLEHPDAWQHSPLLCGLSAIAHLGARVEHSRRARSPWAANVVATCALVELAAREQARLLFVSSSGTVGCYRRPEPAALEGDPFCEARVRRWPYYWSKLCAEREARALAQARKVELVVLRPPMLLGPGDPRLRSLGHVVRLLRGRLPFLVEGGVHFADVRDVAQAALAALWLEPAREVYHLPGTALGTREFFARLAELAQVRAPRLTLPYPLAWLAASAAALAGHWLGRGPLGGLPDPVVIEMAHHYWGLDSRYAQSELGYRSRDPQQTLRDTVAWLRAAQPQLAGVVRPAAVE